MFLGLGLLLAVALPVAAAEPVAKPVVASYYQAKGDVARAERIPTAGLTHLIYAFVPVCAAPPTDKRATGGCPDGQPYRMALRTDPGHIAELATLARFKSRDGFTMIASVGGWAMPHYPGIIRSETSRAAFVESAVAFLRAHPEFDGVDIDWEFPGGGDDARPLLEPAARAAERDGHKALVLALRAALDDLGRTDGRRYSLTTAVVGYPRAIAAMDWPAVAGAFDQVFVMTYDFTPEKAFRQRGNFSGGGGEAGHHTNLHARPATDGYGADAMIAALAAAGVPKARMAIGTGFYAREWKGGAFVGPAAWRDLATRDLAGSGLKPGYDKVAHAAYYAGQPGDFISLDTPASICAKGAWARRQGLAGIFAWEAGDDDGVLTRAMAESVSAGGCAVAKL
jgi:chitinase